MFMSIFNSKDNFILSFRLSFSLIASFVCISLVKMAHLLNLKSN